MNKLAAARLQIAIRIVVFIAPILPTFIGG